MQPWKISIGLTAIILAVALMLAGESFAYLKPYFSNHRQPTTGYPSRGMAVWPW